MRRLLKMHPLLQKVRELRGAVYLTLKLTDCAAIRKTKRRAKLSNDKKSALNWLVSEEALNNRFKFCVNTYADIWTLPYVAKVYNNSRSIRILTQAYKPFIKITKRKLIEAIYDEYIKTDKDCD
jgi:hypothetical protein